MKPASGSGRYAILSVVEWTNPAGGQLRTALTLGPVEITTWWRQGVLTFSRRARGLTTDFGLPVILLIAGWWLQRLQKEREQRLERAAREAHDRRAQEESQRKAAEDARTEKRTQMNAVLTTLLQGNLKDTQQYYLPFATRLSRLIRLLPGARQGTDRDRRLCLHALLAFLRQHKLLTDEIGGHHFQNRRGEVVASGAWAVFFVHLEQRLPIEARVPALKAFQPAMSPVDVMARMDAEDTAFVINPNKPRPLREAERLILDWISAPQHRLETMLPLFSILHAVFAFEINRPFEYWYGSRWEFPVAALEEALRSLPAEPAKQVDRLKEELQSYIAEGRKWQVENA